MPSFLFLFTSASSVDGDETASLPVGSSSNAFRISMVLPNLLLILADDLGHNDVGWSGANPRALTPNMDALVAGGMEMTQHYVFKYCAPSRGMLMTGRYPFHFGFFTNQDANDYGLPVNFTMLPETLRSKGGYRTHAVGKVGVKFFAFVHDIVCGCRPPVYRASCAYQTFLCVHVKFLLPSSHTISGT